MTFMRYMVWIPLLIIILFAHSAHALEAVEFKYGGWDRKFLVHVPETIQGKTNIPAVMYLHGGGGSAVAMADMTGLHHTADKHGFIAVYPEGIGSRIGDFHTWHANDNCCGRALENNIDDVGYISAVIDRLVAQYGADPARIYASGHSNGAMMSYRLACDLSDQIAAIAPNAGQDIIRLSCNMARPVPILHLHGAEDHCAKYAGGQSGKCFEVLLTTIGLPFKQEIFPLAPVEQTIERWAEINACSDQKYVNFEKGDVTCVSFEKCPAHSEVTLCTIQNAGHTWPGQQSEIQPCQRRPNGRVCSAWREVRGTINTDINANEFLWEFFSRH